MWVKCIITFCGWFEIITFVGDIITLFCGSSVITFVGAFTFVVKV